MNTIIDTTCAQRWTQPLVYSIDMRIQFVRVTHLSEITPNSDNNLGWGVDSMYETDALPPHMQNIMDQ